MYLKDKQPQTRCRTTTTIASYEAQGDLEAQHSLLLQVARLENRGKGYNAVALMECESPFAEYESKKRELPDALNMIWLLTSRRTLRTK